MTRASIFAWYFAWYDEVTGEGWQRIDGPRIFYRRPAQILDGIVPYRNSCRHCDGDGANSGEYQGFYDVDIPCMKDFGIDVAIVTTGWWNNANIDRKVWPEVFGNFRRLNMPYVRTIPGSWTNPAWWSDSNPLNDTRYAGEVERVAKTISNVLICTNVGGDYQPNGIPIVVVHDPHIPVGSPSIFWRDVVNDDNCLPVELWMSPDREPVLFEPFTRCVPYSPFNYDTRTRFLRSLVTDRPFIIDRAHIQDILWPQTVKWFEAMLAHDTCAVIPIHLGMSKLAYHLASGSKVTCINLEGVEDILRECYEGFLTRSTVSSISYVWNELFEGVSICPQEHAPDFWPSVQRLNKLVYGRQVDLPERSLSRHFTELRKVQ